MSFEFTQGDDFTLKLTLNTGGVPVSVLGNTITTHFEKTDGTWLTIPIGNHTIIETAGVNVGRVDVDMTAELTAQIKKGLRMDFYSKMVEPDNDQRHFWGVVTRVREIPS